MTSSPYLTMAFEGVALDPAPVPELPGLCPATLGLFSPFELLVFAAPDGSIPVFGRTEGAAGSESGIIFVSHSVFSGLDFQSLSDVNYQLFVIVFIFFPALVRFHKFFRFSVLLLSSSQSSIHKIKTSLQHETSISPRHNDQIKSILIFSKIDINKK